jgi:IS30 family transposase
MEGKIYRGFAAHDIEHIWKQWKLGYSLSDIGRDLRKHAGSIHHVVASNGGIAPAVRRRGSKALTLEEREEISRGIASKQTIRQIASGLNRSPSTISREINRNEGKLNYRACMAESRAWDMACRAKISKLQRNITLNEIVSEKLALNWSPEQISGWLKTSFPKDIDMQISHETIYKSLFIQSKRLLNKSLRKHLRSRRLMRRPKNSKIDKSPRGQIIDPIKISDRPPEIEDRAIPGHWEGDLISGSNNTHIATLVERKSRFVILVKVKGKDTISVVSALKEKIIKLPPMLRISLTWDRGMELANHKQLSYDTNIDVYFCDPRSPWQRGTNENTNRLLRQYFPKKTDLSIHTQEHLDQVAKDLNERPRKTLNFETPADSLQSVVAMID